MDKQHVKSQVAMEFMVLVGISVLVFLIMLAIISEQIQDINNKEEIIRAEDIAIKIQKEINLASRVLDGYYRRFYLPHKLGNFDYEIIIGGNELIIKTRKQDTWVVIPDITGNITKGFNTINKTGGIIYLN